MLLLAACDAQGTPVCLVDDFDGAGYNATRWDSLNPALNAVSVNGDKLVIAVPPATDAVVGLRGIVDFELTGGFVMFEIARYAEESVNAQSEVVVGIDDTHHVMVKHAYQQFIFELLPGTPMAVDFDAAVRFVRVREHDGMLAVETRGRWRLDPTARRSGAVRARCVAPPDRVGLVQRRRCFAGRVRGRARDRRVAGVRRSRSGRTASMKRALVALLACGGIALADDDEYVRHRDAGDALFDQGTWADARKEYEQAYDIKQSAAVIASIASSPTWPLGRPLRPSADTDSRAPARSCTRCACRRRGPPPSRSLSRRSAVVGSPRAVSSRRSRDPRA